MHGKAIGGQLVSGAGKRCLLAAAEVGGVVPIINAEKRKKRRDDMPVMALFRFWMRL
jgi:hypothetical protein